MERESGMRMIETTVVTLAMTCLIACVSNPTFGGQDLPPGAKPVDVPASTQPAAAPATEPVKSSEQIPAELTVADQGQEPRVQLRYQPKQAQKQVVNLTLRQFDAFQAMGEQRRRSDPSPPMVFRMETEVKNVDSDGNIQYVFGFTEGTALEERGVPELNLKGKRELASMIVGVTGNSTISSRGFTQDAGIVIPPTVNRVKSHVAAQLQHIRNLLEQNWLLLPDQPVGVGAKWQVVSYSNANPNFARIKQTAQYEVVSVDSENVRVSVTMVESSGRQPPRLVLGGASQTLISHSATGKGTILLDLKQLMPMVSNITMDVQTEFEYEMNGHREPYMVTYSTTNQIDAVRE